MLQRFQIKIFCLLVSVFSISSIQADSYSFQSGPEQVVLIELYTSEGCSSCPPADRWLSSLKNNSQLWHRFVPVAMHVDYWDYLGWRDPWAKNEHSVRQRQYRREGSVKSVYTPGFLVAGREWRSWFRGNRQLSIDESELGSPGNLSLQIDESSFKARFDSGLAESSEELVLHIAWLGMDLEQKVRRGENRGKTLKHDFVLLESKRFNFKPDIDLMKRLPPRPAYEKLALVAWVSSSHSQKPIQAIGGLVE